MHVDAMTKKGEVSFAKECKRLLYLRDEISTKGDKKHTKREAEALLKQKYYLVHKWEDILFNGMKDVYKILNNQDKVKIKHFYHIICDPDLDKRLCSMRCITCACTGCFEQLSNPWLPNLDNTLQQRYDIEIETFKYYLILRGYNKLYISKST